MYTCICCAEDFEDSAHVEFLVAAALVFGEDGTAINRFDYGIKDTSEKKAGRRIKFCGTCAKEWKVEVADYLEAR